MSGNERSSPIELSSDEDWKNRVKAEDAALDQRHQEKDQKTDGGTAATSAEPSPETGREVKGSQQLPEATFSGLLGMLSTQAMVTLGLIADPSTGKPNPQFPVARYFIDLIAVLERTTKGNLAQEEAALLDETLHSLRMTYVQCSNDTK